MKTSKSAQEKRKEERACLPSFFEKHIKIAKGMYCEECGEKLRGHVSEIAHVLPKSYFKSIMCNDNNVHYLCGMFSDKQCHSNFDNWSAEKVKTMNIYETSKKKFKELEEYITENINYKVYDKFE